MPSFFKRIKNFFTGRRNETKRTQSPKTEGSGESGKDEVLNNEVVIVAELPPPPTEIVAPFEEEELIPDSSPSPTPEAISTVPKHVPSTPTATLPPLDDAISQAIYEAVNDTWSSLKDNSKGSKGSSGANFGFKVIAAFVAVDKTEQPGHQRPTVLSIGTGSKWLSAENFELDGGTLLDCHAEIIARRAFLCVLYENLQAIRKGRGGAFGDSDLILEPASSPGEDAQTPGGPAFRLKSNLALYLYVSKSPCGSAQFPSSSTANDLRVKKGNKGSISFVGVSSCQPTSDFKRLVKGRDETILMSCTDKATMWAVAGVQGALLSAFVEPIFLSGLVYSEGNYELGGVQRALFGRVNVGKLDESLLKVNSSSLYSIFHQPAIGSYWPPTSQRKGHARVLAADITAGKNFSTAVSLNWFRSVKGSSTVEMVDTEDGLVNSSPSSKADGGPSRLSKKSLAALYSHLTTYFSRQLTLTLFPPPPSPAEAVGNVKLLSDRFNGTYFGLKQRSAPYMAAKGALKETLAGQGLGRWMPAPAHVDFFTVQS